MKFQIKRTKYFSNERNLLEGSAKKIYTFAYVMRNESNMLNCNGNRFCLIAVSIVEIIL